MQILLSGASSFTGRWFAQALVEQGADVCALFQAQSPESYQGVRRERVARVMDSSRVEFGVTFGEKRFLEIVGEQSWDVYCHHASDVTNYRSPDFAPVAATEKNTYNLRKVWELLARQGAAVAWTGTVFEAGEGVGSEGLSDINRYGLSKRLSWELGLYEAQQVGIPIGKFVIPNPFGPEEEPRFTSYLMSTWAQGKEASVRTPSYVRDNIHVSLLAKDYANFVSRLPGSTGVSRRNPSGFISRVGDFAERLASEVRARTDWECALLCGVQEEFLEPYLRVNSDSSAREFPEWSEAKAWDDFVEFYLREGG